MKTPYIYRLTLTVLLLGISLTGMAQGSFDGKKKSGSKVNAPSMNAIRIDASRSSTKSTYSTPAISSPLQKALDTKANRPLQPRFKKVIYSSGNHLPVFIQTIPEAASKVKSTSQSTASRCYDYLNELKPVLQVEDPGNQFSIKSTRVDRFSKTHIRLNQVYKEIPVYGSEIMVHLNEQGAGELFNGRYVKITGELSTTPGINTATAIEKATLHLNQGKEKQVLTPSFALIADRLKPEASLTIFRKKELLSGFRLVYHVVLFAADHHRWEYFIDAADGEVIHFFENTCHVDGAKTATAKDCNDVTRTLNTYQVGSYYYLLDVSKTAMYDAALSDLPDKPQGGILTIDMNNTYGENQSFQHVVSTNNAWLDPSAVSAHYNAGIAYDYYYETFSRNSIDGNGGTIISIVNVPDQETGDNMDNAFWNGRFMCYGNGDVSFRPLAGGLDVAGHEMTHGVIENTANLEYDGESGAINESFADIFGSMMDDEDWLIGEDVVLTQVFTSGALRSLSDPHNGGNSLNDRGYQPDHMNEKYTGSQDNNGVHINSGIPNHAFYNYAQSIGRSQAANVYYKALTDYLTKSSQFIDLRMAVIQAATDIHGAGSEAVIQAGLAFDAVGISDGQPTDVISEIPENPGQEFLLVYNTDPADMNTLYRSDIGLTDLQPLTTSVLISRPSVTDDGVMAVFVADDNTLRAIVTSPDYELEEFTIQDEPIWSNAVISKDGNRIAAVTADPDTTIWVYDFVSESWGYYTLYNPTYLEDLTAAGVLYADALEFDITGEFLVYDAFNTLKNNDGEDIEYWDVNFIRVWDNNAGDFGDGTIYKLFSSIPEGVSIGNPSFSKNSPHIVAFDYFVEETEEYAILGCNIETNEVNIMAENNYFGWPSFNKDDTKVAFTSAFGTDDYAINYVNLNTDKISSDGMVNNMFTGGAWPVYFATGQRTGIGESKADEAGSRINCYPNPFTDNITLEIPRELTENFTLEILNPSGQVVYTGYHHSVDRNILTLNLKGLSKGIYIIRLRNEKTITSGRIIKTE